MANKNILLFFTFLFFLSIAQAVTVTVTQASTMGTGHYSFAMDPVTGKFYSSSGYSSHTSLTVYANASAFASNTVSTTINLSNVYYGTYAVAYADKFYARTNGVDTSVGKWNLTTGTLESTKTPFTNMNTNTFNWGGYSTVN